jgi:hypothetical protein
VAKPDAKGGKKLIDTRYLPKVEDESVILDDDHIHLGVAGKVGLPGPLVDRDTIKTPKLA